MRHVAKSAHLKLENILSHIHQFTKILISYVLLS